jgi:uncharacterized protein YdaU (DUF1376 family)
MSNRAWMPLHIDDYISDTDHLTAAEHGAYLLLIMKYWREDGLPSDEGLIRRYAKLSVEQWGESRDVLAALFEDGWRHKRIDAELHKAAEIIEKRKAAGKTTQFKGKSPASAEQMPEQMPSKSTAPLTYNQGTVASATDAASPVDVRAAVWSEGVSILVDIAGTPERSAKSLVGKWLRDNRDDCALVLSKIRQAKADRMGEPVSWITAALKPPDKPPKPLTQGESLRNMARAAGVIDDTGHPIRRLEISERDGENPGAGDAIRLAIAGDHSW